VCLESQSRYLRTFEQIYSVWNLNSIAYQLKTRSMIENLLYNLVYDSAMGRTLPQISIRLMDLLDYIHSNYMNRLTSNDLSRVINYSPSHIRRLFMNEFKMTPVKYINKLRIEKACELMLSEPTPLCSIAEAVGFENAAYFSRVFKAEKGMSPGEYRTSFSGTAQ